MTGPNTRAELTLSNGTLSLNIRTRRRGEANTPARVRNLELDCSIAPAYLGAMATACLCARDAGVKVQPYAWVVTSGTDHGRMSFLPQRPDLRKNAGDKVSRVGAMTRLMVEMTNAAADKVSFTLNALDLIHLRDWLRHVPIDMDVFDAFSVIPMGETIRLRVGGGPLITLAPTVTQWLCDTLSASVTGFNRNYISASVRFYPPRDGADDPMLVVGGIASPISYLNRHRLLFHLENALATWPAQGLPHRDHEAEASAEEQPVVVPPSAPPASVQVGGAN